MYTINMRSNIIILLIYYSFRQRSVLPTLSSESQFSLPAILMEPHFKRREQHIKHA